MPENNYTIQSFPKTRIATFEVGSMSRTKHHISALLEVDVTDCRQKLKVYRNETGNKASFTSLLLKIIAHSIKEHAEVAGFLKGKRKLIIFDDVNISVVMEKKIGDSFVPIPLVIRKVSEKSLNEIHYEIENAKNAATTEKNIVLNKKTSMFENLYYLLPGFVRRMIWGILFHFPKLAFNQMGNVAFTSLGMFGKINGWFIPTTVHPICFGISSIVKKPVVIRDEIQVREILNFTVILDHDVVDGAPIARFINKLNENFSKPEKFIK